MQFLGVTVMCYVFCIIVLWSELHLVMHWSCHLWSCLVIRTDENLFTFDFCFTDPLLEPFQMRLNLPPKICLGSVGAE